MSGEQDFRCPKCNTIHRCTPSPGHLHLCLGCDHHWMPIPAGSAPAPKKESVVDKDELERRRLAVLELIVRFGGIDGDHHKAWVLDQVCRILTGCPTVRKQALDVNGVLYDYDHLEECDAYKAFVKEAVGDTFEWDIGVPP